MKHPKPPKLTPDQRKNWNNRSRFVRIIPAPNYAAYLASSQSEHIFDEKGRRVK